MAKRFNGVINEDIRDSVPDWAPYEQPKPPQRAPNVREVIIDVSGEPYVDLELEAIGMMKRD